MHVLNIDALVALTALRSSTPWLAQGDRSPSLMRGQPMSSRSSLRMLSRLEGRGTPVGTLKLRPHAWPGPW